jgi:hypothetical protein
MNLDNTGQLQKTKHVFVIVIAASFAGMAVLFFGLVWVFKKNGMFPRKISLHGKDAAKFQ